MSRTTTERDDTIAPFMMNFTPRGRAKLADDQFVGDEWKVIEDVALEVFRIFRIVVVGVFAHDDIRIPHGVPDEARLRKSLHGVCGSAGSGPSIVGSS